MDPKLRPRALQGNSYELADSFGSVSLEMVGRTERLVREPCIALHACAWPRASARGVDGSRIGSRARESLSASRRANSEPLMYWWPEVFQPTTNVKPRPVYTPML